MLRKVLGDKVEGVHLGSSYEVRDPISREISKKPVKPFLVNQATLILERGQLRIPHLSIDETIVRQMTNYTVSKISAKTGEPTYTNVDEHALDALMLSLFAFIKYEPDLVNTIEKVEFAKKSFFESIKYVDPLKRIYTGTSQADKSRREYINSWDEPLSSLPPRKISLGGKKNNSLSWGARGSGSPKGSPRRKSW